jgi:hypothetical protein
VLVVVGKPAQVLEILRRLAAQEARAVLRGERLERREHRVVSLGRCAFCGRSMIVASSVAVRLLQSLRGGSRDETRVDPGDCCNRCWKLGRAAADEVPA